MGIRKKSVKTNALQTNIAPASNSPARRLAPRIATSLSLLRVLAVLSGMSMEQATSGPSLSPLNVSSFPRLVGETWQNTHKTSEAKESVYILDWWLSPELYLRRPPARNEQYRLDNMLKAAAERGVQVNVIVYKEVAQALTRKSYSITPAIYWTQANAYK
jgi:hypothetical protein